MANEEQHLLEFGSYRLDLNQKTLFSAGEALPLAPKVFDTLLVLVEAQGRIVEKEELLKRVWPDTFVEEGSLARNVSLLRKVLGENPDDQKYIQTVPKRGYRFVATVSRPEVPSKRETPVPAPSRTPWIWAMAGLLSASLVTGAWMKLFKPFAGPPVHSIAVMPFANLSQDPDYLADGVTDAIITSLSQIHSLQVFSRSATLRYRQSTRTAPEVGRELGADALLEGTVQRSGGRARVSAQLVRAVTGTALWSREFEFDVADILKLEGEVARTVAAGIRVEITPEESRQLAGRSRKIDPGAQQLFLKARDLEEHRAEVPLKQALDLLGRAIEIQPDFAEAWASLSRNWMERGVWGAVAFRSAETPARRAALKAIELDSTLAEGHAAMGQVLAFYDWAWESSEQEFRRAVDLDPNAVESHRIYGGLLEAQGRLEEALAHLRTASQLDPGSSRLESEYARGLYRARRYSEAIRHFQHAHELDPGSPEVFTRISDVYEMTGQYQDALESLQEAAKLRGQNSERSARFAALYAWAGRPGDALRILQSVDRPDSGASPSVDLALAYFKLGDRDRGFYWLTRFFDRRGLVMYTNAEPRFDIVRDDPRFQALIARLALPGRTH